MSDRNEKRGPGLTGWILIAFAAGIGCGLFFGESMAVLKMVADGFIRLMQMAVLPYVIVSLVAGLGSLSYREAGVVARNGGLVLLLLWALTIGVVFAIPLAYPEWKSGSFFSTTLIEPEQEFDFIGLYIPANPFRSLSDNSVPAVVLFCIAVGIALIGVRGREILIENLNVLSRALQRITSFVVNLTPIGVFAIAASSAGTLTIEDFERLQVHVFTYMVASSFVVFWLMPALVSALTPIRYGELLRLSRDALVTAFSTGSTFVVLPMLAEQTKKRLAEHAPKSQEGDVVIDVLVPVSFNFPNAGRIFALSFVLFATWFTGSSFDLGQHAMLAFTGIFSLFGNVNVAIPFLLDLFQIPADMFQLFTAVGIIESRFATLLAAMHILTLALLATCAIGGMLKVQWGALLRYAGLSAVIGIALLGGTRWMLSQILSEQASSAQLITTRTHSIDPVDTVVHDVAPAAAPGSRLEQIHARGVLRVGYSDLLPISYRNDAGELVGHDIDLMHELAHELGVGIEFVPRSFPLLAEHLETGVIDISVGVAATTDTSEKMALSDSYLDLTLALVVPDHHRQEFATREALRKRENLHIAVAHSAYYEARLREFLPKAEIVRIDDERQFFEAPAGRFDAMLHAAEIASAWTLLYPSFGVVIPGPGLIKIPVAYPLPREEPELAQLVDRFIELKQKDQTLDALYRYWILGSDASRRAPRWSVIRDVLHWVE